MSRSLQSQVYGLPSSDHRIPFAKGYSSHLPARTHCVVNVVFSGALRGALIWRMSAVMCLLKNPLSIERA